MKNISFITHTGEKVDGKRLMNALNQVANDLTQLAKNVRIEDAYASHVSEKQKEDNLLRDIERADQIRLGNNLNNFTIWQRINNVLTGECVAFFNKSTL